MARRNPPAIIKPITIFDAHELCNGVQVHCLRCANLTVLDLDVFGDREVITELTKHRRFRCARCRNRWVETRPNFKQASCRVTWYGLTKKGCN